MARRVKKNYPLVALKNLTVLPGMVVHLDIKNEYSIKSIEISMAKDQKVLLVTQIGEHSDNPEISDLYEYGCVCNIKQIIKMPGGIIKVLVEGEDRAQVFSVETEEYNIAKAKVIDVFDDIPIDTDDKELMARIEVMTDVIETYSKANPRNAQLLKKSFEETETFSKLLDSLAAAFPAEYINKQEFLETISANDRYLKMVETLMNLINVTKIKRDILAELKKRTDEHQREFVLREQMKIIKDELGEGIEKEEEEFKRKLSKLKASKGVKEQIQKEIDRYGQLNDSSSESAVSRGYIETLLKMPWDAVSKDNKNINRAEKILNEDHYGLEKVKERMLEFLSVRSLTKKGDSPIICLVGPPGTGKTSIAKSVARALDKKYARICLGGVRDEAEIRGHRRTYVGAMSGRIATALKNVGVKNPLILLDEIDKMSSDYKGDTASALLEVLDSEQNSKFVDHYIEIPIDLSEVLFIATANSMSDIPAPLLDRLEIIEVSSYTQTEKFHIAKEHLIKKQIEKNGLKSSQITIADGAINEIIRGYTKEAGVRSLERKISEICRKSARKILQDGKKSVKVTKSNLHDFLGNVKYEYDNANENDDVGIVRGLAVTSFGGDTLQIEVNVMPGKGEFKLTGQLGDVMKESAMAGISYLRSVSSKYNIANDYFKENDIHIHIPEGSVPKDGPSAGISMATAMLSAITGIPVRCDVAMTGEITLRGRVLPIGGLKEKMLAAKNAGIKTVIAPKKNMKDADEIEDEIKKGLKIVFVESMDEVLKEALAN